MKNKPETDYSIRAFLHELTTKKDVQKLAAQAAILMFTAVFGLAVVLTLYNAITGK